MSKEWLPDWLRWAYAGYDYETRSYGYYERSWIEITLLLFIILCGLPAIVLCASLVL